MTILEVFEIWKKNHKKDTCCNASWSGNCCGYFGFCNCNSKNHETVRYGLDHCPENCSDYCEVSDNIAFSRFLIYYHNYSNIYNSEFNINKNDKYYYSDKD